jgi:hypothetical protein
MAKVKCYSPLGVEEMKEPVDAKEAVEFCGYTMEAVEPSDPVNTEEDTPAEDNIAPVEKKRGRPARNK